MLLRLFSISLFTFLLCKPCSAQTGKIDRLKKEIGTAKNDKEKTEKILLLCEERQSLSTDTLHHYASMAKVLAVKNKNKLQASLAEYDIAYSLAKKEKLDTALLIIDKELQQYSKNNNTDFYLRFSMLKARFLYRANNYSKALSQLYDVLSTATQTSDTASIIMAKTGIGWIQLEMEQPQEALNWFSQAANTSDNKNFLQEYSAVYSNLAATYNALKQNDSAEFYIDKAISCARKSETLTFLATSLMIQSKIFIDTKRNSKAEAALHEAIEIRKLIQDPYYIVYDMSRLAEFYAFSGEPEKGIEVSKAGIEIAKKSGLSSQLYLVYKTLAENYKASGDYKKHSETLEIILALKDSQHTLNSSKILAELQAKYEGQKKENTIIQQKLNLVQKNYQLYGSLLILVIVTSLSYIAFKNYRKKQKLKMQYMLEEEKRLAMQAVTQAEEAERKRIAADLHDNLGAYAASIASNLDHINVLQTDAKKFSALKELKNNAQSIVSQLSDTIWVLKKDSLYLTAISDRLKVFIQRLQPSYPDIQIDVIENITTDHLLPPSQAFHLFQVLQEAINNALRHSECRQISILIESDESWKISVTDDGKGFKQPKITTGGNGLFNMQSRAKEAGWNIEWQQNMPAGTSVQIVPTTN